MRVHHMRDQGYPRRPKARVAVHPRHAARRHRLLRPLAQSAVHLGYIDANLFKNGPAAHHRHQATATISAGEHFLVVLDEVMYPLRYGWIELPALLASLRERPPHVHVVLTGRGAPQELVELADTVTEMTKHKHHFDAGVPAQRGIED